MSVDEISAASDIKAFVEQELQELEQEEEVKGSVPALDLRPSTHAVDSPTSAVGFERALMWAGHSVCVTTEEMVHA